MDSSSMAESDAIAKPSNLASGRIPATPTSKFHSHFFYKLVMAIFFLLILPLVPSQAPDFINQTLLTRSWELLHLLFVGIAVSYGLFSRRTDEKEDEIGVSKFDNVQSYVSGLLHVSSVFDDEPETPSANSNDESVPVLSSSDENNKVQTWSNRYFRNESVVVAEQRPVGNDQRVRAEKPLLLLPVRSLKSRVVVDRDRDDSSRTVSGSKPRARRLLSKSKRSSSGEIGGVNLEEIEDKLNENVTLRSPVPWRSRSGRIEMQEEAENLPVYSTAAPMEESESNWIDSRSLLRPQTSRSSRASAIAQKPSPSPSPSPSPRKPSPSPTVSPELQAKSAEDLAWKKNFYRSPPPPPPPPPPPTVRRVSSMKPSSGPHQKDLRRSFTSKPRSSIRDTGDDINTIIGATTANSSAEALPRNYVDSQSMGKSVRTVRPGEVVNEPQIRGREFGGNDQLKGKMVQNLHVQEFEENPIEFPDEEDHPKEELVEKLAMETDDDDMESDEEEDDMVGKFIREDNGEPFNVNRRRVDNERSSSNEEEASCSNMENDGGPDVDKKADEFIAKFREQIRLQRIESIKRSSGQIRRNTSRQT